MNYFFLAAGAMALLGGSAHTILGDRWTVTPLNPAYIGSIQNSGEQNKRYLQWFWHVGSVVLLSTAVLLLLQGSNAIQLHAHLLGYIAFLWLGTTAVFFAVSLRPPTQAHRMIPGLVGIPINLLILAGLA